MKITQSYLKERYGYDPETGLLYHKRSRYPMVPGRAVYVNCSKIGYPRIRIDNKYRTVHRLIWLYVTGESPPSIDHKDGDKSNNRFSNLRAATLCQNRVNQKLTKNNTSGYRGVTKITRHNGKVLWQALFHYEGKRHYLGQFEDKEEAHRAYEKKAREIFGEFYCAP